jgi:hypothetical protein
MVGLSSIGRRFAVGGGPKRDANGPWAFGTFASVDPPYDPVSKSGTTSIRRRSVRTHRLVMRPTLRRPSQRQQMTHYTLSFAIG